jgi:uncharacterized membrane protein YccC
MAKKTSLHAKLGAWAFIIGIIVALIIGLISQLLNPGVVSILFSVLVLLGIVVGFLNVTDHEVKDYLLTAVSLVIVSTLGGSVIGYIAVVGPYLAGILQAITTFVVPTTIIVALKEIFSLAKN